MDSNNCCSLYYRVRQQNYLEGFCFVLPSLLVVIQTISLIVALVGIGASGNTSPDLYLSTRGIYEVSSKDNIIVIVLDRLDEIISVKYLKMTRTILTILTGLRAIQITLAIIAVHTPRW